MKKVKKSVHGPKVFGLIVRLPFVLKDGRNVEIISFRSKKTWLTVAKLFDHHGIKYDSFNPG